jgi:hypothetical protein
MSAYVINTNVFRREIFDVMYFIWAVGLFEELTELGDCENILSHLLNAVTIGEA